MKFRNPERLQYFLENSLGLARDNSVKLVEHNSNWKDVFAREAQFIKDNSSIDSLILHHCGSTSIPDIVAKPIIDIVGAVSSLEELDQKQEELVGIGYHYKGEFGIPGRRYSTLYDEEESLGFCHLHIFELGDPEIEKHLRFRDYLRGNASAAKRYEDVKLSLNVPRSEYTDGKAEIIKMLLKEAEQF